MNLSSLFRRQNGSVNSSNGMDGSAQSPLVSGGVAAVKVELPICCQLIQCKQKEGEIVFQPLPLLDHVDQKTTAAVKPSRGRGRPPRSSKPSIPSSPGRKRSTPPMRMVTRSAAGLHAPSVGGGTNHVPSGRVVTVAYFALIRADAPIRNEGGFDAAEARWFPADALPHLPPSVSIARRLIEATAARLRGN